jgi:hypothetical protein
MLGSYALGGESLTREVQEDGPFSKVESKQAEIKNDKAGVISSAPIPSAEGLQAGIQETA